MCGYSNTTSNVHLVKLPFLHLHNFFTKSGKTLTEKRRDLQRTGTNKHMETYLRYFNDHRCLSRSEEYSRERFCDRRNISNEFSCAFPPEISSFSVRMFPFFCYFYVIRTSLHMDMVIFLSMQVSPIWWNGWYGYDRN